MEPKKNTPCFFKVLIDPSSSNLPLPPDFVSHHLKNKIPPNPTLTTQNGEFSWQLKIKKIDGDYCFAHGWDKVVKDVRLGYGDFLVFWQTHPSVFQVLIFGRNGIEKDLSSLNSDLKPKNIVKIEDDDEESTLDVKDATKEVDDDDDDGGVGEEDPSFKIVISDLRHNSMVRLPRQFVRDSKIHSKPTVTLEDHHGGHWPMKVNMESGTKFRFYLSSGWRDFRRNNDLCDGDLCLFKFVRKENKLTLTILNKQKSPSHSGTGTVKRKRGRPRLPERPQPMKRGQPRLPERPQPTEDEVVVKRKRGRPRGSTKRQASTSGVNGTATAAEDGVKRR